ncbi:MAG: hypothetical protein R2697_19560 [Ilumatobacteraceae bacterium]
MIGLASLLFGIIEGPAKGWTHDTVIAGFVVGAVALGAFIAWEMYTPHPMLQMTVFKNARFTAASLTITLVFFALFGSLFLMTQYWQLVHGYSPLEAGVRLLPHAATMMIVAPLSARLVERVGTKRVVLTGLTLITTGLLLLSTIQADTPYVVVISFFVVMASGMGMTMAPATESVMGSLPATWPASARRSTTRPARSAVHSVSPSSVRSCRASTPAGSTRSPPTSDWAPATATAESSLGGAQRVANELGNTTLFTDANIAFTEAMTTGMLLSAVIIIGTSSLAGMFLPARASEPDTTPAATPAERVIDAGSVDPAFAPTAGD